MCKHLKTVLACVSLEPIQLLGNFRNSQNTLLRNYIRVCNKPTEKEIKAFEKVQYNNIINVVGTSDLSGVKIKMNRGKIILTGFIVESN